MTIYQALSGNAQARETIEEVTRNILNVGGTIADLYLTCESVSDVYPVNPTDVVSYAQECWVEFASEMPDLNREELLPAAESVYLPDFSQEVEEPQAKEHLTPALAATLHHLAKLFRSNPKQYYHRAMAKAVPIKQEHINMMRQKPIPVNSHEVYQKVQEHFLYVLLAVYLREDIEPTSSCGPLPDRFGKSASFSNGKLKDAQAYWVSQFKRLKL
jgi:hypothetical protein